MRMAQLLQDAVATEPFPICLAPASAQSPASRADHGCPRSSSASFASRRFQPVRLVMTPIFELLPYVLSLLCIIKPAHEEVVAVDVRRPQFDHQMSPTDILLNAGVVQPLPGDAAAASKATVIDDGHAAVPLVGSGTELRASDAFHFSCRCIASHERSRAARAFSCTSARMTAAQCATTASNGMSRTSATCACKDWSKRQGSTSRTVPGP
jgi:hypothetical protein